MRVTRSDVIDAASEIADREGLNQVSLKAVAQKLELKTPSLYNHIDGVDELWLAVAHQGMRAMNRQMLEAAVGRSGDEAVEAVGGAYFQFLMHRPGVYETIQWAVWHGNRETEEIFGDYRDLFRRLVTSCNLPQDRAEEIQDILMGFLHGYSTMQLKYALENPKQGEEKLREALDTLLLGIHQKYGKK